MEGGMVPVDLWRQQITGTTDQASKELESLLGRKIFNFPKPKELVMRIVSLIINGNKRENGIILDYDNFIKQGIVTLKLNFYPVFSISCNSFIT